MLRLRRVIYPALAILALLTVLLIQPVTAQLLKSDNPLAPPNTTSPRSTLTEFIQNMDDTYNLITSAYKDGKSEGGWFYSAELKERAYRGEEALERAIKTLDLSEVSPAQLSDFSIESAIQLKEILDRIPIPPLNDVPDLEEIKKESIKRWDIPDTEIAIVDISDESEDTNFVFSRKTVARLKEFYGEAKTLNYKENDNSSIGFYEFYISKPGGLLPPKWSHYIPEWSNIQYLDQALWQWFALFLLFTLAIALIITIQQLMNRHLKWIENPAQAWLGLTLPVLTFLCIFCLNYLVNEQVKLTGHVLLAVTHIDLILEFSAGAWFTFLVFNAIGISLLSLERFKSHALQSVMIRNGFRLLGILAGAAVVAFGFTRVGLSPAPLIASLGAGSLALSFGLRPYLQDVIGGITLFTNGTLSIGDRCEFGGMVGDVEDIGLRFTAIRAGDRCLITIPNAHVSSTLVNHSRRDKYLFNRYLELSEQTPIQQVPKVIAALSQEFENNHDLEAVKVYVASIGQAQKTRLDIEGYVLTTDEDEYCQILSALMLDVVAVLETVGAMGKVSKENFKVFLDQGSLDMETETETETEMGMDIG